MQRRMMQLMAATLAALALAGPCPARTRPDQVLVIYNQDWTEDLDGSEPGQDSEEIARYYVARRTDPATGLKPYLLGLTAGKTGQGVLNVPVLEEKSSDNWLGLVYKGPGELRPTSWPLTKRGEVAADLSNVASVRSAGRFLLALIHRDSFGTGQPTGFTAAVTPEGGQEKMLLSSEPGFQPTGSAAVVQVPEGLLLLVDLVELGVAKGTLHVRMTQSDREAVDLTKAFALPEKAGLPAEFQPLDRSRRGKLLAATGILDGVFSQVDTLTLLPSMPLFGLRIAKADLEKIDPASLTLSAGPLDSAAKMAVLYRDGQPTGSLSVTLARLTSGDLMVLADFQKVVPGPVLARVTAQRKADATAYTHDAAMYNLPDFEPSTTGPDGVRDDQAYLDTIETPIKTFLENTRTADGKLLKDHILYIVVVHGLPIQVRSLYGIERGAPGTMTRGGDLGSGSALTQRVRMLYYDVTKVQWAAALMLSGSPGLRVASIGNPLRACMTGSSYNPYLHPLTHNSARRERVWTDGKLEAMKELRPTPFSTEYRAQAPAEKFLYAATRIDAADVATAKAQIDGAMYGEVYLTPKLGPLYFGTYQEGPFAAKALGEMGFRAEAVPGKADRALLYFGVFGYGALTADQVGKEKASESVWLKGFYPGSTGTAIRSFLGWDRSRPPLETVKLFDQLVRGGVTVTCGSAGGSHDTNLSWWDNYIFHWMLFGGYEYGDATLRSMLYLDWTIDMVGDPLYRPDLSQTKADATPPQVARREDITLEVKPCGGGKFAVEARVKLANADPEMAEIRLTCRAKSGDKLGQPIVGANTHYAAAPRTFALGLEPATAYVAAVELTDPYGNRFESGKALGPLEFTTPAAPKKGYETGTDGGPTAGRPAVYDLRNRELDESGEIRVTYTPAEGDKETVPVITGEGGRRILDAYQGFQIGGARLPLMVDGQAAIRPGRTHTLVLRWRRFPVTREVALVDGTSGKEYVVTTANTLPWNPAAAVGNKVEIGGKVKITSIRISADAAAAPWERRGPYVLPFDAAGYYGDKP